MGDQKTVDLLWNCASKLTDQTHTERLLKSYYITTCRKLARHNVQLPEDSFGSARMCSRCGNQWTDGRYQLHLQPQRLRQSAKSRRLIAQLETVRAKQTKGEMSSGARKRAKWLKKRMASQMAVDCEVCRHKTMLPLEKGKKRAKAKAAEETMAATQPAAAGPNKKKAKKKKSQAPNKDINAGLKIPQQQKTPQQQQQQPAKSPAPASSKKACQPVGKASQNPSQTSKKKKKKPAQPAPVVAAKTQSKTQKQNALLQLAAQLKSNAFKDASKSQQNRLQAFLK
nr:translation initiation factor IF-2 [Drosophila takahashii]